MNCRNKQMAEWLKEENFLSKTEVTVLRKRKMKKKKVVFTDIPIQEARKKQSRRYDGINKKLGVNPVTAFC